MKDSKNTTENVKDSKVSLPPLDVIIANLGFWLETAIVAARCLNEEARKKAKDTTDAVSKS